MTAEHPAVVVAARGGAAFSIEQSWTPIEPHGWRVTLAVTHDGPSRVDDGITVSLSRPSAAPWWLIPGAFYGENRPLGNDRVFPRFQTGAQSSEDHAAMVSDEWEFRADRCATPAVFVWPDDGSAGLAMSAVHTTEFGMTGVGFRHRAGTAVIRLGFPYVEGPVSYYGDDQPREALAESCWWEPGQRRELEFSVFELPADRHSYAPVLRELHAASASLAPLRPWIDVPTAADLAADGLLRWHYDPDPGVLLETAAFDRGVTGRDGQDLDRQAMHVGWVSGIPWAYALLRHGLRTGKAEHADAARRVIDFIAQNLSPSGTFWGVWYRDRGWTQSWTHHRRGLHSRTLGEATLFLVRALELEPNESWVAAVRSNLDTVVGRQRSDGNLGAIHHAETGEVLSWTGSAALTWIPALVEASHLDERYLPAAERAGEYYAAFVDAEFLHGAPEDVDLAPTSEDGYVALMAYLALYRATGHERWLRLARKSADWMLTFRYSYDVAFDRNTLLGQYDFGTRGADQASPSNQHLHAYGLVCHAELLELSDSLGDDHYRARAEETLACFRQFIARQDGDFNAYRGMVSERYYQTSCFQPKGMLLTLSHAWSVGVLLLACEQELTAERTG